MKRFLVALLLMNFVILTSGCASGPPKPVLPDGLHRVPINRERPVPPLPSAASAVGAAS
ncbi:hypothetical protein Bphyt_6501 [Paraburkholderia phytofirmans PsJN]|uniref:Uncharacterized protein n=1 Tax=Paraburkholderia phytofirmans (strain DSM 17436 / LMG 22146 / PsJN) TaxID=398527 RepID=B2T8Z8_PARPJ|nr:hypothetical protein Bphyt_6501 [Paraburkholderia phytofirmans PsJN]